MGALKGHLASKKTPGPRNLQKDYAYGPMVVLGGGRFLMSELPLYRHDTYVESVVNFRRWCSRRVGYFTEICSGSEAGSYLRLIDFFITQL